MIFSFKNIDIVLYVSQTYILFKL